MLMDSLNSLEILPTGLLPGDDASSPRLRVAVTRAEKDLTKRSFTIMLEVTDPHAAQSVGQPKATQPLDRSKVVHLVGDHRVNLNERTVQDTKSGTVRQFRANSATWRLIEHFVLTPDVGITPEAYAGITGAFGDQAHRLSTAIYGLRCKVFHRRVEFSGTPYRLLTPVTRAKHDPTDH